jgi:argininosuccinate lyase
MNAWAAATYLVQRGVPFRLAHEVVGKAVRLALEKSCVLKDLSLDDLKELSPAFDQEFYACLSLQAVLAIHDVPGGTAPGRVRQAMGEARKQIERIWEESHAHA